MSEPRTVLLRRIAREHRGLVVPVLVLIALNVLLYLAFIYPLSRRVNSVTERTQAAEAELATARLAHLRAQTAVEGRSDASTAIETFFGEVLPAGFPEARRTLLRTVTRETQVRAERASVELLEPRRNETLTQARIRMDLTGSYRGIREFIHRLEHADDFLVIDSLDLADSADDEAALTIRISLSTYFRRSPS